MPWIGVDRVHEATTGYIVCVILTLPGEPHAAPELPVVWPGPDFDSSCPIQPLRPTRGVRMAIKRIREAPPLWVWLAVALLACGALAYVAVVSIIEYLMAGAA